MFIKDVFLGGGRPIISIFWQNFARNIVSLIPKMVKVTLRVHYETLDIYRNFAAKSTTLVCSNFTIFRNNTMNSYMPVRSSLKNDNR